ncbi:hypothetical protein [Salinisphaera aquimarina]|uniref:Uncharacterized protein n=1 Tax=Salinisphaera aquimarina TaxID=2094031 RepID=A0ABV7EPG4_9GAMM
MFKIAALDLALKKPAPRSIPLSGPRASSNDFYAAYLDFAALELKLLVKEKEPGGYSGRLWYQERDGRDCTFLNASISSGQAAVKIEHYYKGNEFNYTSAWKFLLCQKLRWHDFQIVKARFLQRRFNKKQLIRTERIELLFYLVEKELQSPNSVFDPLYLGMQRHGRRWFYHPDRKEHEAHLKLVMNSLVATKDLKLKDNHLYVVEPKAMATLSQYEREERQHHDSMRTASMANRLAGALIGVTVLGLIVQLIKWYFGSV